MRIDEQWEIGSCPPQQQDDIILEFPDLATAPCPTRVPEAPEVNRQHLELVLGEESGHRFEPMRVLAKPMDDNNGILGVWWTVLRVVQPDLGDLGVDVLLVNCELLPFEFANKLLLRDHTLFDLFFNINANISEIDIA